MEVALDFGTTNSALAVLEHGDVRLAQFWRRTGAEPTYPSVLYFHPELVDDRRFPLAVTGAQGIEHYLEEDDGEGRLIQSIKSYLVSASFLTTQIFVKRYRLEELVAQIVEDLKAEAEAEFGTLPGRIVCGRPVHFSKTANEAEDAFAVERLERSLRFAGFSEIRFVYEPVAAAFFYERALTQDELVLIADFGGGTSDFTLMHVGPSARNLVEREETIIGTHGVPVAGNAFDYEIVRELVTPHLGRGTHYITQMQQIMEVPASIFADLEWHRLSVLNSARLVSVLEEYIAHGLQPARLEAFLHIIQSHLGYHLYRSVEGLKVALSSQPEAMFSFVDHDLKIEFPVKRETFNRCIERPLGAIAGCVDELLERTGISPEQVDRVFMTGGTSFVPAVRTLFEERFGPHKVATGEQLTSVVRGLAWSARTRGHGGRSALG